MKQIINLNKQKHREENNDDFVDTDSDCDNQNGSIVKIKKDIDLK